MNSKKGIFLISLDFELYWGVRDSLSLEQYKKNLIGTRQAIAGMLKLFHNYGIHTTWSTVGFLFFNSKEELINNIPTAIPEYENKLLSPYHTFDQVGHSETDDPFHFAPSIIRLIASYPNQVIGTHTFSHYYCLEKGQNKETFKADLNAALNTFKKYSIHPESIVFPRNHFNPEYLEICKEAGIKSFRSNVPKWIYKVNNSNNFFLERVKKGIRFLDYYFNILGHNTYPLNMIDRTIPFNLMASRFLRPYNKRLRFWDTLKLRRIKNDLNYAAKNGEVYHLWWHPHNFGIDVEENLIFLEKILKHFKHLNQQYGMNSLNMEEISNFLEKSKQ